jgi:hypothetical protein
MLRRPFLAFLLPLVLTFSALAEGHVKFVLRTDPPTVAPGGWVDVVMNYTVDPELYFASPNSTLGPRAEFAVAGPKDWRSNTSAWAQPGRMVEDPKLGAINVLRGRGVMRHRFQVPEGAAEGVQEFTVAFTCTVSDGKQWFPAETLEGKTSVSVVSTGARGPQLRNLEFSEPFTAEEEAFLSKNGFVVRAEAEFRTARSRDVVGVAIDIYLDEGVHEDALNISCEAQEMRFVSMPGWRAFRAEASGVGKRKLSCSREVMPLEFWDQGLSGDVTIPVQVTLRTTREGEPTSRMATREFTLSIRYQR